MAKYILGNRVRKVAERRIWLSKLLWFFDLLFLGGIVKLMGLLPVDRASAAGRWLGRAIGPIMSKKSQKMRDNLRIAFPDKTDKEISNLVVDIWGNSGSVLAEYPHLNYLSDPANGHLKLEILEPVETYSNPEKPAVFVSAHLSNWEMAASGVSQFGIKFISLYSPLHNAWLDQLLKDSRQALGCELLPRDVSMRPLVRALGEKRSVAMVVDRRVDEGELVPFFGCGKISSTLPAKLALKYNCPLIPVRTKRISGASFKVIFYPPVVPRNPGESEIDQTIDMMAQVHQYFEQWIREDPGEWFCSKRLWPKEPK